MILLEPWVVLIGCGTLGFIICFLITPWVIDLSTKAGIVDRPGERRSHQGVIPRTGGVAIAISFLAALVFVYLLRMLPIHWDFHVVFSPRTLSFLLGLTIMFAVGFVDDVLSLPAKAKLLSQLLVALLCIQTGLSIDSVSIGEKEILLGNWSWLVTAFWILLVINSVNFIDGVDGLLSGIALMGFAVIFVIFWKFGAFEHAGLTAIMIGILLAFRYFNVGPARIFLGDSGSHFVGFCLAALMVSSSKKGSFQLLPMVIILAIPLLDLLRVSILRVLKGLKTDPKVLLRPWKYPSLLALAGKADGNHIHHLMINRGLNRSTTVVVLETIAFVGCILALWLSI